MRIQLYLLLLPLLLGEITYFAEGEVIDILYCCHFHLAEDFCVRTNKQDKS